MSSSNMATKENKEPHNSVSKASDSSMAKAKEEPAPLAVSTKATNSSSERDVSTKTTETCAEGVVVPVAKRDGDPCHKCCGKRVAGRRLYRKGEDTVLVCETCSIEEKNSMTTEELEFHNQSIADSKRASANNAAQAHARKVGGTVDQIFLQYSLDPKCKFLRVRDGGGFMVGIGGITAIRKILATFNYKFGSDLELIRYLRGPLGFDLHERCLQPDGKTIISGWETSVLCFIKDGFEEGCTNFGLSKELNDKRAKHAAEKKANTIALAMEEFKKNPDSWLESEVCKKAIENVKGINKKVLLIAAVAEEALVNPSWKTSAICKKALQATRSMEVLEERVREEQLKSDDERKSPAQRAAEKKANAITLAVEEFKKNPNPDSWLESEVCKNAIENVKGVTKKELLIAAVLEEAKVNPDSWKKSAIKKKAMFTHGGISTALLEERVREQQLKSDDEQRKPPAKKKSDATAMKRTSATKLPAKRKTKSNSNSNAPASKRKSSATKSSLPTNDEQRKPPAKKKSDATAMKRTSATKLPAKRKTKSNSNSNAPASKRKSSTTSTRRNSNSSAPTKKKAKFAVLQDESDSELEDEPFDIGCMKMDSAEDEDTEWKPKDEL